MRARGSVLVVGVERGPPVHAGGPSCRLTCSVRGPDDPANRCDNGHAPSDLASIDAKTLELHHGLQRQQEVARSVQLWRLQE